MSKKILDALNALLEYLDKHLLNLSALIVLVLMILAGHFPKAIAFLHHPSPILFIILACLGFCGIVLHLLDNNREDKSMFTLFLDLCLLVALLCTALGTFHLYIPFIGKHAIANLALLGLFIGPLLQKLLKS